MTEQEEEEEEEEESRFLGVRMIKNTMKRQLREGGTLKKEFVFRSLDMSPLPNLHREKSHHLMLGICPTPPLDSLSFCFFVN